MDPYVEEKQLIDPFLDEQPRGTAKSSIVSLPHELLSNIFEIACDLKLKEQLQVSNVCQRFHAVATNTPRLWTYISFKPSPNWIELQLSRSGHCGLTIDFRVYHPGGEGPEGACSHSCAKILAMALQHIDRWTCLHCDLANKADAQWEQIDKLLRDLHFPRLRVLTLDDFDTDAWETWTIPCLQILHCDCQKMPLSSTLTSPLKSLSIGPNIYCEHKTPTLLERLREPNVIGMETLTLALLGGVASTSHLFGIGDRLISPPTPSEPLPVITMPSLRTLTIDMATAYGALKMDDFFNALDLPGLETCTVKIDVSQSAQKGNHSIIYRARSVLHWLEIDLMELRRRYPRFSEVCFDININEFAHEETLQRDLGLRLYAAWTDNFWHNTDGTIVLQALEGGPVVRCSIVVTPINWGD